MTTSTATKTPPENSSPPRKTPKKSAPRKHVIRIRFNDDELAKLDRLCEDADRDKCDLLRDHLGKLTVKNRTEIRQTSVWLNRINANINQVAKWVNTYKADTQGQRIMEELIMIRVAIDNLVEKGVPKC